MGATCTQNCDILRCVACEMDTVNGQDVEICTHCERAYYGDRCLNLCNSNCVEKKCNRHGECMYGCVGEYFGPSCDSLNCTLENCELCQDCDFDWELCTISGLSL